MQRVLKLIKKIIKFFLYEISKDTKFGIGQQVYKVEIILEMTLKSLLLWANFIQKLLDIR